jgi:hypothetical protein
MLAGPPLLTPVHSGDQTAGSRRGTTSVPTAPGDGAFSHPVKTPVKALGNRTENERAEKPSSSAAGDHRQWSR